ncbi:large ribosomal subunit protein uL2-like [Miscanthus floridulus]|uniref:large ribosomal subunit protein uL2-like n=1 Tax=Miscanthus floridulus TaxID=154761 RepID=UPI00345AB467
MDIEFVGAIEQVTETLYGLLNEEPGSFSSSDSSRGSHHPSWECFMTQTPKGHVESVSEEEVTPTNNPDDGSGNETAAPSCLRMEQLRARQQEIDEAGQGLVRDLCLAYYKYYYGRRTTLSIGDVRGVYTGQLIYYGCRATLSISNIPPLRRTLEGAVIYNASAWASGDYAIVDDRDPDSDVSARASRDYAIITGHNPDNGVRAGNPSRQRRSTANDGEVDDARRPPAPLLLRQR